MEEILQSVSVGVFGGAIQYLADLYAKGFVGGIGKDHWEKIKSMFSSESDAKTVASFESSPNDEKNQAKLELLFEQLNERDTSFQVSLIELLQSFSSLSSTVSQRDLKNVIINSNVNNSGIIKLGDGESKQH